LRFERKGREHIRSRVELTSSCSRDASSGQDHNAAGVPALDEFGYGLETPLREGLRWHIIADQARLLLTHLAWSGGWPVGLLMSRAPATPYFEK